jgi:hypothetical protein
MSLREIIDAQGRKQVWLAEKLGMSKSRFNSIIAEQSRLPADKVAPLAQLLGVPTDAILAALPSQLVARFGHAPVS